MSEKSTCFNNFWYSVQECKDKSDYEASMACFWDCQVDFANCISRELGLSKAEALDFVRETIVLLKTITPRERDAFFRSAEDSSSVDRIWSLVRPLLVLREESSSD